MTRNLVNESRAALFVVMLGALGAVAQEGLIGHWPMDEAKGRTTTCAGASAGRASLHGTRWHGVKGKAALGFYGRTFVELGDPEDGRFDLGAKGDFEELSCGALVDANAIVGTFPGNPKSNDPEGKTQQPYHPRVASGGFLLITSEPPGQAEPATLIFAFYDEKGTLLHEVRKIPE